ncbi:MAG TPA: hypothetical protein ENJ42_01055 [Hellea balneolensis]|uniref:Uncharacterized protein n=1 Tax=Hellea balneolensis TaxID=287478 RepID=A0A7C5QZE9_9PROT|nr:hypothetical protein [Hellea balneolensis]
MLLKHIVIGLGIFAMLGVASGCKEERDNICEFTWAQHGYGPADRVPVSSGNGYYLADLDGDGFIIEPEFNYYCTVTQGKSEAELLQLKALAEEAQSIGGQ